MILCISKYKTNYSFHNVLSLVLSCSVLCYNQYDFVSGFNVLIILRELCCPER
jgi:hypothetical protein